MSSCMYVRICVACTVVRLEYLFTRGNQKVLQLPTLVNKMVKING